MNEAEHSQGPAFLEWLHSQGSVIETHASWVVLSADRAYKFKKPVDLGFLDFSSREKRKICCERELELNRRLAPSVYLAVEPLYRSASGYVLGDGAKAKAGLELVDHAVVMRRLRQADCADALLGAGQLEAGHLQRLAAKMVDFHRAAPHGTELSEYGSFESVGQNVRENFGTLASLPDLPVDAWRALEAAQLRFFERHGPLFQARAQGGHIKDGHGDLRLEHVYFEQDEVVVVDCIEFNDRFRFGDVALDLAFLTMDLRRLARPDLAEDFLAEVAHLSGDYEVYTLVDFYESYRATVRAKVAALRAQQLEADGRDARPAREESRAFLSQALWALEKHERPRLIGLGGLIASGKSTIARGLSSAFHAAVIDSDSTRKRLFGVDPWTSLEAAPFSEAYSEDASRRTYDRVLAHARSVLASGRSVIVDASFRTRAERRALVELAQAERVPLAFIECSAEDSVVRSRLRRRAEGPSKSDGRESLLDALRGALEPIAASELDRLLRCDTSVEDGRALEQAIRFVNET